MNAAQQFLRFGVESGLKRIARVINHYETHDVVFCPRGSSLKAGGAGGKKSCFWIPPRQPKIAQRTSAHETALINEVATPVPMEIAPICAFVQPLSRIVSGKNILRNAPATSLIIINTKATSANCETRGCRRHRDNAMAAPITQTMINGVDIINTLSVGINISMRHASICERAKRYVKYRRRICPD